MVLLLLTVAVAADPVWVWGDLHAHSGWSFDGCEDPDAACAPLGETPAADFYAVAAEMDLDFAALTDHAEADLYLPEGEGGPELDVWEGQAAVVQAADGGPVLPLLGYEWTAFRDDERRGHGRGSHRTVLLGEADPCVARRISGFQLPDGERLVDGSSALYLQEQEVSADNVRQLWDALDAR